MSAFGINAIIVLDAEGHRIVARYYLPKYSPSEQKDLEEKLHRKTENNSSGDEVISLENFVILYKSATDASLFIVGGADDNPAILDDVLTGFHDSMVRCFKGPVDKRAIFENLDMVLLILDELIDSGLIFETDPSVIESRIATKSIDENPLSEANIKSTWKDLTKQYFG
eukprot:TRINITY_DN2798_c0_g1_i1.p1 TRINITY_DN2798_c0_g1~~TRINITY_DN2798_c0_g1_i1.p1  ORF type:complete len:169 (+),score=42.81 TRINITY_DN2798_c0_g1_i1:80-586(+)